ncbi:Osmotically inducible protein OsmY [Georgfuchsia toluolica]|uniref:Osmotically inducible protein OsmY n=2 Tax=Georgfuchsia toluolica TaxID=424218 RepID=A0A916J323_9PROT|nr:Osmotically inducible protein OsmY [Georgfuchsia toluolica]
MRTRPSLIVMSIALAGVIAFFIAGCNQPREAAEETLPNPTARAKINDSVITTTVKLALLAEPGVNGLDFKVETRKGKVKLSGYIDNQMQIDRLIAVTRGVPGVKGIKITVNPKATVRMAGNKTKAKTVASRVKAVRLAVASAMNLDTAVALRKDEGPPHGFVDDQSQIDDSIEIARGIDGMRSISNEMSNRE